MTTFSVYLPLLLFLLCGAGPVRAQSGGAAAEQWGGYQTRTPAPSFAPPGVGILPHVDEPRAMLLNTGLLLEGKITLQEKGYVVETDFGRVTIPKANIEQLAVDKAAIYRYKKSQTLPDSTREIMALAEWCLGNGLKDEALLEYRQARNFSTNATITDFIAQRIREIESPEPVTASKGGSIARTANPADKGQRPPEDDLALWSARVPRQVLESYTKKIQPILISRCAAADCHGTHGDSEYQLIIPRQSGGSSTLRNLRATLRYIDPHHPISSPLLTITSQIHGGRTPVFSKQTQSQFETLRNWVVSTANNGSVQRSRILSSPAPYMPPSSGIVHAAQTEPADESIDGDSFSKEMQPDRLPSKLPEPVRIPAAVPAPVQAHPIPVEPVVPSPREVFVDPLDPARFNKRYH